ncbi:endonuclease [Streptococcus phage Str-PAP-1]|uniref:homing endonuclease n=1 Tax=Streptococcus phage Str-PAP-1 TaxID=1589270 RepID=UPI000588E0FA|nr:homing endonuclease [Streptococcus phage Str-PAP-1]AJD83090.1 endonuclease [Streptococcus phage Str-PAP-1]
MYAVYKHTNKINNKVYIGITGRKPELRWRSNGTWYRPKKPTHVAYFYNAILKYGWDSFYHEILYSKLTKEEAEQKEIDLINSYQSNVRVFGYNIDNGGDSVGKLSEETKKKISESWNINKEERSRKISEGKKGIEFTEEHRKNISKAKKGKKATNRRPVSQYDLKMNFIKRWESLEDAQNELGISKSNICRAIKYDRTAGGYKWTY